MIANRLALLAAAAVLLATPVLAEDSITVGFTVSQSGALNNDSVAQMRGFDLWREETNAAGGTPGHEAAIAAHVDAFRP